MKNPHAKLFTMIAAGSLALLQGVPDASADVIWNGGGDGTTFQDPDNWSNGVPDANTGAAFIGSAATVVFTDDAASSELAITLGANVTFQLGGFTYAVTTLSVFFEAHLAIENGMLTAASALIDGGAGAASSMTVRDGATLAVLGAALIGATGEGDLIIENGGAVEAGSMIVGNVADSDGFVDVQAGGSLHTGSAILGNLAGSTGQVDVAGIWDDDASIIVGNAGNGELNIGHDGMGSTGTGGAVTTLLLIVGGAADGNGLINIGEDATLASDFANIASTADSTGTVNVGAGAAWTNHGLITVGALAGTGGTGAINVNGDGLLHTQNLTIGNDGTVTQTGTGAVVIADTAIDIENLNQNIQDLIADGGLFVANNSLSILNGGLLEATRAFIDSLDAQVTASTTVNGEGSLLDLAGGDLIVGGVLNGSLAVTGGGKVESGDAVIGEDAGSSGSVTVSGQDANETASEWEITGDLIVGDEGAGSLTIAGGGSVNTTLAVDIGAGGGDGEVLVTGEGSLLDVGADLRLGFDAGLGEAAAEAAVNAILNVSNGGQAVIGGILFVNETGMLMGDGTITGDVQLFGRLSPGASIGTLTITGDLETHAGSILHIEYSDETISVMDVFGLDPSALPEGVEVLLSDLIAVEGQATLADGTVVQVVKLTGGVSPGDAIIILHAGMGGMDPMNPPDLDVGGTFLFDWILEVLEGNGEQFLLLTAEFDEEAFEDFIGDLTGNLRRVAVALGEGELFDVLGALDPDAPEAGLTTLLPLQHGAAAVQTIRTSHILNNSFLGQMTADRAGRGAVAGVAAPGMFAGRATNPAEFAQAVRALDRGGDRDITFSALQEPGGWGGFIQGIGVCDRVDSGTDRTGHRARVVGGHGGLHSYLSRDFLLGISFGYLNTDLDFRRNFGDGEIHTFRVGPYLSWSPGGGDFFIDASATYGYHRNEINRNVAVPQPATARSKYDAHDLSVFGQAGYDFTIFDRAVLTPLVGAEYTHLRTDSFTESGSGANLDVSSQTIDSLRARLGAKFALAVDVGETTIIPEIYGGWAHEFLDTDIDIRSRFVAGGPNFRTRAAGVGRGALQVGAGFTAMAGTYITLYVRYEGEFQSDRRSHGVIGGLNIDF